MTQEQRTQLEKYKEELQNWIDNAFYSGCTEKLNEAQRLDHANTKDKVSNVIAELYTIKTILK